MLPQPCVVPAVLRGVARSRRWRVALLLALALSLGGVTSVPAATTWTVCASGCDYSRIQAAIAAPTTLAGDTLSIAAGTYTEPGIVIAKSLTLEGEAAQTTIVQAAARPGTAPDRVFTIPSGVTVVLRDLTIRHGYVHTGSGKALGGGLYNEGRLTLISSIVRDNAAGDGCSVIAWGGGIFNTNSGTVTLTNSTLSANAACLGGGLFNNKRGSTVTLTNSNVGANTALGGGGLYNSNGTLTLINSTVNTNTAFNLPNIRSEGGGLVNNNYGPLTLTNSTVSGNSAFAGGGLVNYGPLRLIHSTISGNSAQFGGSGLYNHSSLSRATLTNSIVANNLMGPDCVNDNGGSLRSYGYNLDSDGSCQLTAPTDLPGVDPRLGPLQDHGGPTFTHALLPGSPAMDAIPWGLNGCGTTLYSDQRWQARPQPAGGPCDIGAYEVEEAGHALSAWVTGLTPRTAVCENVTTGHEVMLSAPESPWDCEAAGLIIRSGDVVALRVRGPVTPDASDVGGAVVGLAPYGGRCTNRTTGQQVKFEALFQGQRGATAASCVAAGLVVRPGDEVQLRVRGVAE